MKPWPTYSTTPPPNFSALNAKSHITVNIKGSNISADEIRDALLSKGFDAVEKSYDFSTGTHTFEVSDFFTRNLSEWSNPVQVRFVKYSEDSPYSLEVREIKPSYQKRKANGTWESVWEFSRPENIDTESWT